MQAQITQFIQSILNKAGYRLKRVEPGVSFGDPLEEIARLAGGDVKQIVEVGAFDGADTIKFAGRFPEARVVAFEPLSESYTKLSARALGNARIVPVNAAVANEAGRQTFHRTDNPDSSSLLQPEKTGFTFDKYTRLVGTETVDVVTLDDYFAGDDEFRIDILKMDVQGAEKLVLEGAARLLASGRVGLIYSEVNFIRQYKDMALYHHLALLLESHGYHMHNFYNLIHNQSGRFAWADAIFVK